VSETEEQAVHSHYYAGKKHNLRKFSQQMLSTHQIQTKASATMHQTQTKATTEVCLEGKEIDDYPARNLSWRGCNSTQTYRRQSVGANALDASK
jgi:hypothetical protein